MVFPIVGGNQSSGDIVTNSIMFNDGDRHYLTRDLSSPNTDKFTIAFWVKISGARANVWSIGKRLTGQTGDSFAMDVDLGSGTGLGRLSVSGYNGNSDTNTLAVNTAEGSGSPQGLTMRDVSAWQHHVYAFDTGQASAGDRFKWYVNGVLQSGYNTTTTPSQNVDLFDASGSHLRISKMTHTETRHMDGYIAEFYYVDGQQYDATYFGEFDSDSGIWVPVELNKGAGGSITFGTNGCYLQFKETGTSQNASGMGADSSGNDNHLAIGTDNNALTADNIMTDTPQNNFATWNPLQQNVDDPLGGFGHGNLAVSEDSNADWSTCAATLAVANGKWYWEVMIKNLSGSAMPGVIRQDFASTILTKSSSAYPGSESGDLSISYRENGTYYLNGGTDTGNTSFTSDDIIGVALDMDNGAIYFHKNGTYNDSGDPTSGASKTGAAYTGISAGEFYSPSISCSASDVDVLLNVGQVYRTNPPSSGNSDANGHGNFEYAPPSGYFALCTKNIAEHG